MAHFSIGNYKPKVLSPQHPSHICLLLSPIDSPLAYSFFLTKKQQTQQKKEQVKKWLFGISEQPHWSRLQIVTSWWNRTSKSFLWVQNRELKRWRIVTNWIHLLLLICSSLLLILTATASSIIPFQYLFPHLHTYPSPLPIQFIYNLLLFSRKKAANSTPKKEQAYCVFQ